MSLGAVRPPLRLHTNRNLCKDSAFSLFPPAFSLSLSLLYVWYYTLVGGWGSGRLGVKPLGVSVEVYIA